MNFLTYYAYTTIIVLLDSKKTAKYEQPPESFIGTKTIKLLYKEQAEIYSSGTPEQYISACSLYSYKKYTFCTSWDTTLNSTQSLNSNNFVKGFNLLYLLPLIK